MTRQEPIDPIETSCLRTSLESSFFNLTPGTHYQFFIRHMAEDFEKVLMVINLKEEGTTSPLLRSMENEKEKRKWFEHFNNAIDYGDEKTCKNLLDEGKFDMNDNENGKYFHPLLRAAQKGNYGIMSLLLERNANQYAKDTKCFTALHYTIQQRSLECTELILHKNLNLLSLSNDNGDFPIHLAALEGDIKIFRAILDIYDQNSLNVDERNKNLETPLHLAASRQNLQVMQFLLEKKAKWNLEDKDGRLPLHFAAFNNAKDCCILLLKASEKNIKEHVNHTNRNGQTPLILASSKGHNYICEILKESNVDHSDNKGWTALHYAAEKGYINTIEALIKLNPKFLKKNLNDENTPIHLLPIRYQYVATDYDKSFYLECLKSLVNYYSKDDPGLNAENKSVLYLAAKNKWFSAVEFLLSKQLYLQYLNTQDDKGSTILHCELDIKTLKFLISLKEINKCIQNKDGEIPLHLAAERRDNESCKYLISPETVTHRNKSGRIPLHLAAMKGSVDCCRTLEKAGKGITEKDGDNFTPLHYAAIKGHTNVIKLFLQKKKGFINLINETTGDTVLHLAAREGHTDCCRFIMKKITNDLIYEVNKFNKTALDEACEKKRDETYQEILNFISEDSKTPHLLKDDTYYRLQYQLHKQLKMTLSEGGTRRLVQESIVRSNFWISAFSSVYCEDGQCSNLSDLIKCNPVLTEEVFTRCITTNIDYIEFNFSLFEDSYFMPLEENHSIRYQKRLSPFDEATGKLLQKGIEMFTNQKPHPLVTAINKGHLNLLQHSLSQAYLDYKWKKHISKILFALVGFEILAVITLSMFLHHVWHFEYLTLFKNVSREDICVSKNFSKANFIEDSVKSVTILSILLFIFTIFSAIFEIKSFWMRDRFFTWGFFIRILRITGLLLLLLPVACTNYPFFVKEDWQWKLGIWTLLLSWFYMIHTINEVPAISVFMPVTMHFIISFFKVLLLIFLLILIYAIIFCLLLPKSDAFKSLHISFIKTTVWVLGDLAYEDTFLNKESIIPHPLMTNFLFLLLVTSISGFVVNLIVSKPDNLLEYFRERAEFHKAATRTQTVLKLDNLFQSLKRKYTVQRWRKYFAEESKFIKLSKNVLQNLESSYNYTKKDEPIKEDPVMKMLESVSEELKKQGTEQESLKQTVKYVLNQLETLTKEQEGMKNVLDYISSKENE